MLDIDSALLDPEGRAAVLRLQSAALLRQDRPSDALQRIDQALAQQANSVAALLVKAKVLRAIGDTTAAIGSVTKAIEIDPSAEALELLGDIEIARGDAQAAQDAYARAISNAPENQNVYIKRALVRVRQDDLIGAQADVDVAKSIAPNNPDVSYTEGVLAYQQERYAEAIEKLWTALNLLPDHPGALLYLGATRRAQGDDLLVADEYLSRYVALAPQEALGRKLLARVKLRLKQNERAEEIIRPIVEALPDDDEALGLLSEALAAQGKTDIAIDSSGAGAQFEASLRSNGNANDPGNVTRPGLLTTDTSFAQPISSRLELVKSGELDVGLTSWPPNPTEHQDNPEPYLLAGLIQLAKQDPDAAEQALTRAAEVDGKMPQRTESRTLALLRGKSQEARGHYEDLLRARPNDLSALIALSAFDASAKDETAMVEHLQAAVTAYPDAPLPKVLLGRYYLKKGAPEMVDELFFSTPDALYDNPELLALKGQSELDRGLAERAKETYEGWWRCSLNRPKRTSPCACAVPIARHRCRSLAYRTDQGAGSRSATLRRPSGTCAHSDAGRRCHRSGG